MAGLRRLIHEMHRRSLWQVLSIYLIASWGALEAVGGIADNAGLPQWVAPFALILLILGLPVVLATAVVQEGVGRAPGTGGPEPAAGPAGDGGDRSDGPSLHHRLFTWRNAMAGGAAAFALFGLAVGGYLVLRGVGFSPVATLKAQGVFDEREPVVLSDFANTTGDEGLGRMVTEALRVDLVETSALTVLSEAYVQEALARMGRSADTPLDGDLARELAVREGVKAVVQGEVGRVGSGYVITGALVEASTGNVLAGFRETAGGDGELLRAIDGLSKRIREKAGESLRSIRARESLEAVTTSSLDALRAYTEAQRRHAAGDTEGAVLLLESAVEQDPAFAMAWRKLAAALSTSIMGAGNADRARQAATRAWELRERLSSVERWLTEAYYHSRVTGDVQRSIQAYERVLDVQPDEPAALNNLAILLPAQGPAGMRRNVELLERAVNGPGATYAAHTNLLGSYWRLGRADDVERLLERIETRYAATPAAFTFRPNGLSLTGRHGEAHALRDSVLQRLPAASAARRGAELQQAADDAALGRLAEARAHLEGLLRADEASGRTADYLDVAARLGWIEVWVARDPARARAAVERGKGRGSPSSDPWEFVTPLVVRALAGDPRTAEAELGAWSASVPAAERSDAFRGAVDWATWGIALEGGRAGEALETMERIQQGAAARCDVGRCWGHAERGRALEALGRKEEALSAYALHLDGLAPTDTWWAATMTPLVLERMAALQEELGPQDAARATWTRFAELWSGADPELQPRVASARERIQALR